MAKKYGWFSQQMRNYTLRSETPRIIYWEAADGLEVEITCIGDSPVDPPFAWTDGVCIGEVVRWLQTDTFGRPLGYPSHHMRPKGRRMQ